MKFAMKVIDRFEKFWFPAEEVARCLEKIGEESGECTDPNMIIERLALLPEQVNKSKAKGKIYKFKPDSGLFFACAI